MVRENFARTIHNLFAWREKVDLAFELIIPCGAADTARFILRGREDLLELQESKLHCLLRGPTIDNAPSFDLALVGFLENFSSCAKELRGCNGAVRVGIFYTAEETSVIPFRVSAIAIQKLADLGLSLDATGYPCAADNDDAAL